MKDFLTNAADKVREFHQTFGHPVAEVPTLIPFERIKNRAKWGKEENEELEDPAKQTIEDQCDASLDAIYFALGNFVELGIDPSPLFQIVHEANMAKVWPDGTVHKNEDGKVIKPPGWEAPEPKLRSEIARQIVRLNEIKKAREANHDPFFKPGAHAIPAVQAGAQTVTVLKMTADTSETVAALETVSKALDAVPPIEIDFEIVSQEELMGRA